MPISLYARPEASFTILADTIYLMSNGRSRWIRHTRRTQPLLDPPVDVTERSEGIRRYEVRGDSVFFPHECRDVAQDCIFPPRGRLSSDRNSMTLIVDMIQHVDSREYRRIPD
jgi:hypothetical protein